MQKIEQIEQELKGISKHPWEDCSDYLFDPDELEIGRFTAGYNSADLPFIAQSPQRISELLELVKEAEVLASTLLTLEHHGINEESWRIKQFLGKLTKWNEGKQ